MAGPLRAASAHAASVRHMLERCGSSLNSSDNVQHILILIAIAVIEIEILVSSRAMTTDDAETKEEGQTCSCRGEKT